MFLQMRFYAQKTWKQLLMENLSINVDNKYKLPAKSYSVPYKMIAIKIKSCKLLFGLKIPLKFTSPLCFYKCNFLIKQRGENF